MIVIRSNEVEGKDWGEMVGIGPIGLVIKWLIHNEVGDETYGHRFAIREFIVNAAKTNELPAHRHKYVEALYILSGRIIFKGQSGEQEVGPGDVVYTFSNELHSARAADGYQGPMRFLCVIDCVDGRENCTPMGRSISVVPNPCDGKAKRKSKR